MKTANWVTVATVVFAVAGGAGAVLVLRAGPEPHVARPGISHEPAENAPVGVRQLMQNVDRYIDEPSLTVNGMVSAADSETGRLALIDVAEFEECGTTTCASLTLPVSSEAVDCVSVGQALRITGRISRLPEGLVFAADRLQPLDNPRAGQDAD